MNYANEPAMYHRPPDALRFGIVNRDDIGPGVLEVVWPNGDRSYGRGRWFLLRTYARRMWRRRSVRP